MAKRIENDGLVDKFEHLKRHSQRLEELLLSRELQFYFIADRIQEILADLRGMGIKTRLKDLDGRRH